MTTHKLYGGEVTLVAEKRGRRGGYWIGDRNITRVTSVGVPGPIPPLIWYGAGLVKKKFLKLSWDIFNSGFVLIDSKLGKDEEAKLAEGYGEQLRKAAGDTTLRDRGTEGHRYIQEVLSSAPGVLPPKDFDGLDAMLDHWEVWWDDNEIEVHGVEKTVYSKEFDYAGTLDLDATVNGMRSIVDWKFGKIRTARIQVSAYAHARTEELDILYDQRMVVSITEDGVKTEIYENQKEDFGVFLDLLRTHRTMASW